MDRGLLVDRLVEIVGSMMVAIAYPVVEGLLLRGIRQPAEYLVPVRLLQNHRECLSIRRPCGRVDRPCGVKAARENRISTWTQNKTNSKACPEPGSPHDYKGISLQCGLVLKANA